MNIKFKVTNIDGTALELYFVNYLHIGSPICTKHKFHIGNMVQLLPNMFWEVIAFIKWFLFYLQRMLYDLFA
jgi:hypothetical protein